MNQNFLFLIYEKLKHYKQKIHKDEVKLIKTEEQVLLQHKLFSELVDARFYKVSKLNFFIFLNSLRRKI